MQKMLENTHVKSNTTPRARHFAKGGSARNLCSCGAKTKPSQYTKDSNKCMVSKRIFKK